MASITHEEILQLLEFRCDYYTARSYFAQALEAAGMEPAPVYGPEEAIRLRAALIPLGSRTLPAQEALAEAAGLVPATEPDAGEAPVAAAEPEPVVEAAPEPEPVVEAAPEPEPVVEAAPEQEPEPVVEAAPEQEPEPVVEAAPEQEPVVEAAPEQEPVVEAAPQPEPVVEAAPQPEPVVEAAPQPEPVVEAAPEAAPQLEPAVAAAPPAEPVAEAAPTAEPAAPAVVETMAAPELPLAPEPLVMDADVQEDLRVRPGVPVQIRTTKPGWLHWGIDDWNSPPPEMWPPETQQEGNAARSRLQPLQQEPFVAAVTVGPFPSGALREVNFTFFYDDQSWGSNRRLIIEG